MVHVKTFFDQATNTATHLVTDSSGSSCAVIDPVLDFDLPSGRLSTNSADKIIAEIKSKKFRLEWILETHIHADHITAAKHLKDQLGGKIGIGKKVCQVQDVFREFYDLGPEFVSDGSQFDHLFDDGEQFAIGSNLANAIMTPGHTPACVTYLIEDCAFCGDTLFMPDTGTGRCDFPGGSARDLYNSIQKIFSLPSATRIFVGHDYIGHGRDNFSWETTVADQRESNIHVRSGIGLEGFIEFRKKRDAELSIPRMMLSAIQVNIRAGGLPPPGGDGRTFLKLPLNQLQF
jgi:glyoxylase-like metal-dependent hydrolase (beta-lactamase superfamily II)